ncbi:MAG: helix-turn-helix domain-containing protein [Burkholderiaceae bacterium]
MASIGERIKERREELRMKQSELADRVGISQPTLSNLESDPTAKTREVAKFAAVLGVDALWLAEGKGNKIPDGTAPVIQYEIPPKVLRLAERLILLPEEKLKALSVLVEIKF